MSNENRHYIDKEEYTKELIDYAENKVASERLCELFMTHVDKYAGSASFMGYTYLDEMKAHARLHLIQYSKSFNAQNAIDKGNKPNAFAYCTTIIYRAFLQVLEKEKKHAKIKDAVIKNQHNVNHESERYSLLNELIVDELLETDDPMEFINKHEKPRRGRRKKGLRDLEEKQKKSNGD